MYNLMYHQININDKLSLTFKIKVTIPYELKLISTYAVVNPFPVHRKFPDALFISRH